MSAQWATVLLMVVSSFVGATVPALLLAWRLSASWTKVVLQTAENTKDIERHDTRIGHLETNRRGAW